MKSVEVALDPSRFKLPCPAFSRSKMVWKDDGDSALINISGDGIVQAQLEGCERNKLAYEVSESMKKQGLRDQQSSVERKPKKLESVQNDRGQVPCHRNWKDKIAVLGDRPATEPPFIVNITEIDLIRHRDG
uniref:Uncharacterized protein n=1 Tax=Amphimedon queenslandica TaxID=400682 RepID=A0A1X7VFA3_AMPQE